MSKYLSMLKNLKTNNSRTAFTAKTTFGSKGSTLTRRIPENYTPFGSNGSTPVGHISKNRPLSFDPNYWSEQIAAAINKAARLDGGALEYCSRYRPDLYSECITASRALDDAYATKDAKQVQQAIREHDKACEATRIAAQHQP